MKYLPLILAGLGRKKLRTFLTLLSVLVAFLLYGYLSAIRAAFNAGVSVAGADRVVTRHKVSIVELLPVSYKARIQGLPGVARVACSTWFGGIYQKPANFFPQMVVDPEDYLNVFPDFILPEKEKRAWLAARASVVVGRATAERFGWKAGDRVPLQATVWPKKDGGQAWEFDIAGIYDGAKKGTDTTQMLIRYDYFDETRLYAQGYIGWYYIRVADPAGAPRVCRSIDAEFANSSAETKTEPEKAFVQGFAEQIGDIGKIMVAILSAVFFTILLVAGNTMAQAVRERREELGVLKALGFTNAQVLALVLAESLFLSGLGGVAGLGLAWIFIAKGDPTHGTLPLFYLPPADVAAGLLFIAALGLATGLPPALQAMRLNVAEALRRN
jgi:putative ABC transport system permease protein